MVSSGVRNQEGPPPQESWEISCLPSQHTKQCISHLSTLLKPGCGARGRSVWETLKSHRRLEFFSVLHLLWDFPWNAQPAVFLYEKLEFGHWEGCRENGGGRELKFHGDRVEREGHWGVPAGSPSGSCFSAPFNHIFYPPPPPSLYPSKRLLCCFRLLPPCTFRSFVFILPAPTPLPPYRVSW